MRNDTLESYDEVEDITIVNVYSSEHAPETIVPHRTIIRWPSSSVAIYKVCYIERIYNNSRNKKCVIKSSLCANRCKLVEYLIRLTFLKPQDYFQRLIYVFNWIDENKKSDLIYNEKDAVETYSILSEELFREMRRSPIKNKSRGKSTLHGIQSSALTIISASSGIPRDDLKRRAIQITRYGANSKKTTANNSVSTVSKLWQLHSIHFHAIADHIISDKAPPLVINRDILGYETYKLWTNRLDTTRLHEYSRNGGSSYLQFFDRNNNFILDIKEVKQRAKELGHSRYEGRYHKDLISKIKNDTTEFQKLLHRRSAIHFSFLLLLASGCNPEQLQYIDFSKELSSTHNAKREAAIKPRSGYIKQPIQFSAKFLTTWRKYQEIRRITIDKFAPSFGPYGIPVLPHYLKSAKGMHPKPATSQVLLDASSLGFPKKISNIPPKEARLFKTVNFLDFTSGDISLTALALKRDQSIIRKYYSYKSFEDSALEIDQYFSALIQCVTIKGDGYTAKIKASSSGAKIHTGHCLAESNEPQKISGVVSSAPTPRCGAPITCFFCEHYVYHANIKDIKLILSARIWIEKQTRVISQNIEEHITKYVPFIERIDDILEEFRNSSSENRNIYKAALEEVHAGNYPRYWRNKVNALLAAMEA